MIFKRFALAFLVALSLPFLALADSATTVTSCGSVTLPAGQSRTQYQDLTGRLCTAASSSGSAVTTSTATTGGDSVFSAPGGTGTALITNTAGGILVATGAHSLKGHSFWNTGNATCYIQYFDLAAGTATLGTTVPKMVVPVPTNGTVGGWEEKFPDGGVAFALGIVIAATTTTTGSSACNAAQHATVVYK